MMAPRTYLALALVMLTTAADAAKILALFAQPARSPVISVSPLMAELTKRGHEVTIVTQYPLDPPVKNIVVTLDGGFTKIGNLKEEEKSVLDVLRLLWFVRTEFCDKLIELPEIQELITREDLHFDLIIFQTTVIECLFGLVHKFQAPYIQYNPNVWDPAMGNAVGNDLALSYVPSMLISSEDKLEFKDRLMNMIYAFGTFVTNELIVHPIQDAVMRKHFKDPSLPSISEMIQNASLLMLNSHFSIHHVRPYTPNTILVGGMHVKPAKKLPQDLQKYLDEATDGVIYFSMGSVVRGSEMTDKLRKAFLDAFSKLKQKILWKWETDTLPGQPSNVKLGKWLPQNDILGHPNVRLFITHGGLMSSLEALTHGIPLLAIPVGGDQKGNAEAAQRRGYAIMLELTNVTADSLTWALNQLLNDQRYRANVKQVSSRFQDRPESPLETAVYWIEYVIRHKGAPHLRSAALDLWWFQYYLLDVLAVIIGALFIAVFILVWTCRKVYRVLVGKKPVKHNKEKKNR